MKDVILLILIIGLSFQIAHVQIEPETGNGLEVPFYKELRYMVSVNGGSSIDLTENNVKAEIDSLLEQAGVIPIVGRSVRYLLKMDITIVGRTFSIDTKFYRWTTYTVTDKAYKTLSITWHDLMIGTHGNNASYVINTLYDPLERFLADYLKANQNRLK